MDGARSDAALAHQAPHAPGQVIVFGNPRAGSRSSTSRVAELQSALIDCGFSVTLISDAMHLAREVEQLRATGQLQAVVAAGGDGTVQRVVNHVGLGTPITVLPLGTENLLARYYGITADPARVARVVRDGFLRRVDLVDAGFRRFVLMMGCGFDADVVHRLDAARTGHISHWSYAKPIWQAIRQYRYPQIRVCYDELQTSGSVVPQSTLAHWVFAFNVPAYASGIPFAKQADPADGQLEVCCFTGGSFRHGLFHLATIWAQRHGPWSGCLRFRTPKLRLEADETVPVQLDGDPGGHLPLEVSVIPGGLTLVVPAPNETASVAATQR